MTHPKCLEVQPHEAFNLSTTRFHLLAMSTMHTTLAPPLPVRIPPKGSILSPEWTHAITTIMSHPLSSESGKFIQKWILYHAIPYPFDFWLYWDPTDPYDNKLLQEYVGSTGSVVYLPSSTIKSLINLWNYMNLLIKKEKSVDQKCNAQYFQDDQWFNLTAHDMRRTLVNAGMKYHRPQIIPGTPLPNSTSPPSPAPMKSPIHLELTPCDLISTATPVKKPCPVNTSCDRLPHLDHSSTSLEPQDHSIVGSTETESILESEDLLQLDSISISSQATCRIETETNPSPRDVFSEHHDYEMFLLQKEIDAPHANLNHHVPHACEEQDQDTIRTHATILSHTFALPQFMDQHNCEDQEPTDTPSTIPTVVQAPMDDRYNPECTHNPMAIQCNQYPNPSHNLALPQFLAHHNCEDLDPTDTPSAIPTTIQAAKLCTHYPSTSQVKKSNHTNPVTLPYPPDHGEHVLEMSAGPTTLVKRDKLDLSSLVPPKGEMGSSFSWTCPFKNPTSSTSCFGEPTLGKLKHMSNSSSGTNRVSVSHSSLVTKNGEHFYGENSIYDSPKSLKHIKETDWGDKLQLNFTTYGYTLMEIDWGGKFNYTSCRCPMANCQDHKSHPTGHNTSEVDWGGHDPNPNHVHESSLSEVDWGAHHPSVFLFLGNIDYDAKPIEFFIQGLWGEPQHRTPYIPLIGPQTDSLATGQSFLAMVIQLQWFVVLGRLVTHTQVTTLSKLLVASS